MPVQSPIVTALSLAGSDPSGGAGIQADLKTFSALGVYGLTVSSALTAQSAAELAGIWPVPASFVAAQLETLRTANTIHAMKTGMLFTPEMVSTAANFVERTRIQLVVDPVLQTQRGQTLVQSGYVEVLKQELFPRATLITPNLDEAEVLLRERPNSAMDMVSAARELLKLGSQAVLLKGGHLSDVELVDILATQSQTVELRHARIETRNDHGTGCTYAAAITAFLARGFSLETSVAAAHRFVIRALDAARSTFQSASGGSVQHFQQRLPWWRRDAQRRVQYNG